ncbi:MAG: calcium-binding protein [Actinomycetota bacterium]
MTPLPRGPLRSVGIFALLAAVVALPVPAGALDMPSCNGEKATHVVDVPPGTRFLGTAGDDVIVGTGDSDVIYGRGGSDLICAGDGDDLVVAGRGNDTVYGEGGDDLLFGKRGRDVLYGGAGNDQIDGEIGQDWVYGGDGQDVLYGGAARDRVYGGEGNDVLYGGDEPDHLYGEAGADRLFGEGDLDRLLGGDGDDELQGGSGNDRLFGDGGGDFLWGDGGDDTLIGGAGDDLLQGGRGADNLQGRGGFDELWGGECGNLAGAVRCRLVPSGRPEGDPAVDPDDTYNGGPGLDACNKSPALPPGCDTYRGEHGLPSLKTTSAEWWPEIVRAFEERAAMLVEEKPAIADALMEEVEHAKQVAACESLGDIFQRTRFTKPDGSIGTWDGLFQHSSSHWVRRAAAAGYSGASVFDPLANARVAAWLVAESIEDYSDTPDIMRPAWVHWSCDEWLINHPSGSLWEPTP